MDRRQLLKNIALLTGATMVGGNLFLTSCKQDRNLDDVVFTQNDVLLFDEIAETILPKTETPGAKDAQVGKFMVQFANDCYDNDQIKKLISGMNQLNEIANKDFKKQFIQLNDEDKKSLLIEIDLEAKSYNANTQNSNEPHYFTLMKQMTLLGFFTSEVGSTKVLRYDAMPGEYKGVVPYKQGEAIWA